MSTPLSIDRAVDGNLKPVKDSDGTLTALEISTDNVRVKNLDIAGDISSPLKSGDIILNSKNGVFIQQNNGTEFSVANSAYAGMILGYTAIGIDAGRDSVSVGTSFAVTDADHKVTFVAPPSGKVEIEVNIYVISTSQRWMSFGLSDNATYAAISFPNATDVTNEHSLGDIEIALTKEISHKWVVEGLTAGTSYTWGLGAKAEQAGRITLWWGGNVVDNYPPFIMKATALPATIYDGT